MWYATISFNSMVHTSVDVWFAQWCHVFVPPWDLSDLPIEGVQVECVPGQRIGTLRIRDASTELQYPFKFYLICKSAVSNRPTCGVIVKLCDCLSFKLISYGWQRNVTKFRNFTLLLIIGLRNVNNLLAFVSTTVSNRGTFILSAACASGLALRHSHLSM